MKKHLMLRLDAFLLPKLFVIERNYYASLKYIIRSAHKRLYQESRSITLCAKEKYLFVNMKIPCQTENVL